MRNSERTILSVAVAKFNVLLRWGHILVMATLAHVVSAKAEVNCNIAAKDALPVNVLGSMLFAHGLASSILLQLAVFAHEVFLLRLRFFDAKLCLTVLHTSEVWLFALGTLVECALIHRLR